jgi:hypothetical protein
MGGGRVSLWVTVSITVVVLLETHDHPVSSESPEPTHMGVIGRTDHGEAVVVCVLIPIDLLPIPVGVGQKRILDPRKRLQCDQVEVEKTGEKGQTCSSGDLHEVATCDASHAQSHHLCPTDAVVNRVDMTNHQRSSLAIGNNKSVPGLDDIGSKGPY